MKREEENGLSQRPNLQIGSTLKSELGQKRKSSVGFGMSAFGGRAEVDRRVLGNQPFSVSRHEQPASRKNLGAESGVLRDFFGTSPVA